MEQTAAPADQHGSSYSPDLRRRADELSDLARSIEHSLVMTLTDDVDSWTTTTRGRLCEEMLQRNLHQLHRAADDLRVTAMRFRERADELDAAVRPAA